MRRIAWGVHKSWGMPLKDWAEFRIDENADYVTFTRVFPTAAECMTFRDQITRRGCVRWTKLLPE